MLCLASLMVMGMGVIELALNRFQADTLFANMRAVRLIIWEGVMNTRC